MSTRALVESSIEAGYDPAAAIAARRAKNNAIKPGPGFVEPGDGGGGGAGAGDVTPKFRSLDGTRKMSANFRLYKKTEIWDPNGDTAPPPPAYSDGEKREFITKCVHKGMGDLAIREALKAWAAKKEEEARVARLMGEELGAAAAQQPKTPRQERVADELRRYQVGGRAENSGGYDADAWQKAFKENADKAAFYKERNENQ